jgi:hypothetical protein
MQRKTKDGVAQEVTKTHRDGGVDESGECRFPSSKG